MVTSSALALASLLSDLGFSHVVGVPDNTSASLFSALQGDPLAPAGSHPDKDLPGLESSEEAIPRTSRGIRCLIATREGEAISVASGLWLGGALPAVVIQNTGLLEAGDGLRGTASRMGVPLLLLVTCRGYAKARAAGLEPNAGSVGRDILVRADLDSVAHMTERTLDAWGIPFHILRDPSDLGPVREAWDQARKEERPVAVLLDTPLT
jgi:sulfopyruvate decarboxylase TPP-binding subunit